MISPFGVEHPISKADSPLHIPINLAQQLRPKLANNPKLLKISAKIDNGANRKILRQLGPPKHKKT